MTDFVFAKKRIKNRIGGISMKTWRKIFVTLLVFVLASGTLPAMAAETELITNGGFEEGFEGWTLVNYFGGEPEDLLVTLNPGEGMTSFVMVPGPTLRRDVQIDGAGVYRLTFKMRSGLADSLRLIPYFFTAKGAELNTTYFPDDIDAQFATFTTNMRRGFFGTGESGWYDASFDISVQSEQVTLLRLDLSNVGADDNMVVDDFAITKLSDKANYVLNGQFENTGSTSFAWSNIVKRTEENALTHYSFLETDSDGNQYMYWKGATTNQAGWCHQTVYLPSGRYKFSVDLKGAEENVIIPFAIDPKLNEVDTLWNQYGGINSWLEWRRLHTDWRTHEIYFSVPKDAMGNDMLVEATFYFPMANSRPTTPVPTFWADNVAIECAEESSVEFSNVERDCTQKKVYAERDKENKPVQKLSSIGPGGTLPVSAIYTPKTMGVAEKATLVVGLYQKTEDGKLQLVNFKAISKTVDIGDGVNGASAQGLVLFNDSITLPSDLDNTYVAKAFIWEGGKISPIVGETLAY